MASEKKAELEMELAQKENLTKFQQTYVAFIDSLVTVYSSIQELNDWKKTVHEMAPEEFMPVVEEWSTQLAPNRDDITKQEPGLFLKNLPCLVKIYVPQLWVQDKFTVNSKRYVWLYINSLLCSADAITRKQTEQPNTKDIQPPNNIPGQMPGIGDLYKQMPKSMIDKVKGIADKYSNQVENGETKLEDLKFNEISQELFQNIDSSEMQQVVQSIGGMLQNVMSGTNTDELQQLFQKP